MCCEKVLNKFDWIFSLESIQFSCSTECLGVFGSVGNGYVSGECESFIFTFHEEDKWKIQNGFH